MTIEAILFLIIAAAAVYWLLGDERARLIKAVLKTYPVSEGQGVKENELIRIKGKVVILGRSLTAPLSNRECVYYHVRVKDSSGPRELFKNHIDISETRMTDIVLYDGTHYIVVNKHKLFAHIINDHIEYSDFLQSTSPELRDFLKRKGERTSDYFGYSLDLRCEEGILEAGETLELLGIGKWVPAAQFKQLKLPSKKVLYLDAADEKGVYLTDEELG